MIHDSSYELTKQKINLQIIKTISATIKNEKLKIDILNNKNYLCKTFEAINDVVSLSKEHPHLEYYDLLERSSLASAIFQDLNLGKGAVGSSFGLTSSGVVAMSDFNLMKAAHYASDDQIHMMKGSEYQIETHKREVMDELFNDLQYAYINNPNVEKYLSALEIMDNNRSHVLQLEHKEFLEEANVNHPEKIVFGQEQVLIMCGDNTIKVKPIQFTDDLDIMQEDYSDTYKHEYLLIDDLEVQTLNLSTRINVNFQYFDENEGESKTAFISYDLGQGKFMTNPEFDELDFSDSDIKQLEMDVVEQVKKASLDYIKEQSFEHPDIACKVCEYGIPVFVAPVTEIGDNDFRGTLLSFNHYHGDMSEHYYNVDGDHQELHFTEMSAKKAELALNAFDYTYKQIDNILAVKNKNDEDCSLYELSDNQFKVIEASEVSYELRNKLEDDGFTLPERKAERRLRRLRRLRRNSHRM